MESQDVKQNVKLGAFVLGGLILFLVAVFYIGSEKNVFNKTFTVSAIFKNVEGLKEGDNVWLSGVKIGTVKSVRIITEGKVVVSLSLKDKQNEFIRKDATAFVGSDGLVGNKIVVIRTGISEQVIHDHDTINSLSPPDTQELINIAKEVGDNTKSITLDLKQIAARIKRGEGVIGELVNEGQLSQDIRSTVSNLKQTGANTTKASAELSALLYEMKNGDGLLPTLIGDTTYSAKFNSAIANVEKVSKNASAIAANLEDVTKKMNSKDNAIGVLLADSAFAHKLHRTLDNAEDASSKLDENLEAMRHNFLFRRYFKKKAKEDASKPAKVAP